MKIRLTQEYTLDYQVDCPEFSGDWSETFKIGTVGEVENGLVRFGEFQFPLEFIEGLFEVINERL